MGLLNTLIYHGITSGLIKKSKKQIAKEQEERLKRQEERCRTYPFKCDHCGQPMDPNICEADECGKPAEVFSYYEHDEEEMVEDWEGYDFVPTGRKNRHWFIRCEKHAFRKSDKTPKLVMATKEECLIYLAMHQ